MIDIEWAGMPVWATRWRDLAFDLKVARSADSPVAREYRRDGPVTCGMLVNGAGRLTGYTFDFARDARGPRIARYRNSVVASYAQEPPWPEGLAVVMTSPHVRILRVGQPDGPAIYQVVFRHVDDHE
jgi:hypothetical protein